MRWLELQSILMCMQRVSFCSGNMTGTRASLSLVQSIPLHSHSPYGTVVAQQHLLTAGLSFSTPMVSA